MEYEDIYRKIQEFFGGSSQNFSLMEDPVDVNLQMKYFEMSSRMSGKYTEADMLAHKDELYNPKLTIEKKKNLLVQMASVASPEIFRVLEEYSKQPDEELKDWSKLALQETRITLESQLLDNRQVFISTGLGGKGNKIRYFVVLINKNGTELQAYQKKIVQDEMQYALQRNDSELEKLEFIKHYITMLVVVPISSDLTRLFRDGINECNQFGDFLSPDFIVTNMKAMSEEEINDALSLNNPVTDDDFPPVD